MIREERTVFLTVLTFVFYSIIQFWEKGVFLFPFPLNEAAILIIFLYFVSQNKNQLGIIWTVLGLSCLLKLLSQQFFWSIILPNEKLEFLFEGMLIDLFYLLYSIFWTIFIYLYFNQSANEKITFQKIGIIVIFILGILLNQPILEVVSFLLSYLLAWKLNYNRIFRSLIGLIIVLESGKILMSLMSY
jgi:hypothetical protein